MKATRRLKQPCALNLSTETLMKLMTSATNISLLMFFKCATLYRWKISCGLAHSNSPDDHYFSGLHCKSHAHGIANTNNKVDSSHTG